MKIHEQLKKNFALKTQKIKKRVTICFVSEQFFGPYLKVFKKCPSK